jgi:GNAT superfamily N-acetyltransferase
MNTKNEIMEITQESIENIPISELTMLFSLWTYNPTERRLADKINSLHINSTILIARQNDEPFGALVTVPVESNANEIIGLGIIQSERNKGIGSELLKKIFECIPQGMFILETDEDAVEFYLKNNFHLIQEFRVGNRKRFRLRYASTKMKFRIAEYTPSYEEQLLQIYNESKIQEFINYPEITSVPRIQDDLDAKESLDKATKIIALIDEHPIGFAGWNGNYISHLYVSPYFQKQGVASKLLAFILDAPEKDWFLFTTEGNTPAIKLFRKNGFSITEEMDYTYHGKDIKIIKMKQIGS